MPNNYDVFLAPRPPNINGETRVNNAEVTDKFDAKLQPMVMAADNLTG